jgi:AAA+ ATPase superfamily predicted ATPase
MLDNPFFLLAFSFNALTELFSFMLDNPFFLLAFPFNALTELFSFLFNNEFFSFTFRFNAPHELFLIFTSPIDSVFPNVPFVARLSNWRSQI